MPAVLRSCPGRAALWTRHNVGRVPQFPSMKARDLLRVLAREPLCYQVDRRSGSHMRLTSDRGYGDLLFAFHDRDTVSPQLVRKILVKDVGLTVDEAVALL